MKSSISCIGNGFVGGSITTVFTERGFDVYAFDLYNKYVAEAKSFNDEKFPNSITELVQNNNFISEFKNIYFVCVPTPMYEDGEADLSIVEDVLNELSSIPGDRIAVVKSTIPPGTTEKWNKKYESTGLRVIFNPEFLTEANAIDDMRHQNRIILGGPRPYINKVKQIFQMAFPKVPIIKTSSTTAEMVKYFTNIHLASRVVLSCEFYQLCEKLDNQGLNIDYDKVVEYANYDLRLGNSHMNVPGFDGIMGARGHCFPKDLAALIYLARQFDIEPLLMKSIQDKNLALVPPQHRDWEKMVGRAFKKRNK